MIFDYPLGTLKPILRVLDEQLDWLDQEANTCDDPDSLGIYDQMEHIVGVGFAACQQYLTSVYGSLKLDKCKALGANPKHESGMSIAQIVDHAANYWKHHEEWATERHKNAKTVAALKKLRLEPKSSYLLFNVLAKIVTPARFGFLL